MSARPGAPPAPDFVNRLLGANFAAMARMGDPVLKPFLQASRRWWARIYFRFQRL